MQLPTVEGETPTPRPIGVVERWRAAWHGHRDATASDPMASDPDEDQSRPYLESLRAQAEAGQRAVSGWLHDKIVPVDREAVRVLILLEQHRRDPVIAPEAIPARPAVDDADPRPMSRIPPWLREAREAAATRKAFERRGREHDEAERRLGELGCTRHHLIQIARAAAHAHLSRYHQLVGLYDAALRRRSPGRLRTAPPQVSTEPWLHGDLPLLALDVEESYRWFLKEFETRTSARQRPVLGKVPRAS